MRERADRRLEMLKNIDHDFSASISYFHVEFIEWYELLSLLFSIAYKKIKSIIIAF